MQNWTPVDGEEYKKAWDFIYDELKFQLYSVPIVKGYGTHCRHFDTWMRFDENFVAEEFDDLHETTLRHFKKIGDGRRLLLWIGSIHAILSRPFFLLKKTNLTNG